MKVSVFVSIPTTRSASQEAFYHSLKVMCAEVDLEFRTLGITDYPIETPFKEVLCLARHCSGGIVLGFSKIQISSYIDSVTGKELKNTKHFPTPWNQIEAGMLYGLGLPLLVLCEPGIDGGIFDKGAAELYIHEIPTTMPMSLEKENSLGKIIRQFAQKVHAIYRK